MKKLKDPIPLLEPRQGSGKADFIDGWQPTDMKELLKELDRMTKSV